MNSKLRAALGKVHHPQLRARGQVRNAGIRDWALTERYVLELRTLGQMFQRAIRNVEFPGVRVATQKANVSFAFASVFVATETDNLELVDTGNR